MTVKNSGSASSKLVESNAFAFDRGDEVILVRESDVNCCFVFFQLRPGEIINGKYCECNNMDCPKDPDSKLICGGKKIASNFLSQLFKFPLQTILIADWLTFSGPDRGECVCSNCSCFGNWTGPSCSCTKETEGCMKDGVRLRTCFYSSCLVAIVRLSWDCHSSNAGVSTVCRKRVLLGFLFIHVI